MTPQELGRMAAAVMLCVYALGLLGVGLWAQRRARAEAQFLLGERTLGPWVAGLAYAATSSSAWVLLGFSGFVYAGGPSALWMVPGILLGYLAVWLGAGPFLQREAAAGRLTLTDILAGDASGGERRAITRLAGLLIGIAFAFYVGAQLQGVGQALSGAFGAPVLAGVIVGALLVAGYTALGGFHAVSIVDTVQGIIIAGVAIMVPALTFLAVGGLEGVTAAMRAAPEGYFAPFGGAVGWAATGLVVGLFATGFGALGQPHLVAWVMAARDTQARIRGAGIATLWAALVYAGMALLGLSARALLGPDAAPESVFLTAAGQVLPPVLLGLTTAAVLSAILSTVDSQLLVAATAVSRDLSGKGDVSTLRWAMAGVCVAAVLITALLPASIFNRTLFAWTALGASFGTVLVARALGARLSPQAVIGALALSFSVSMLCEFVLPNLPGGQGPGAVWARTLPWVGGVAGLGLGCLLASRSRHER